MDRNSISLFIFSVIPAFILNFKAILVQVLSNLILISITNLYNQNHPDVEAPNPIETNLNSGINSLNLTESPPSPLTQRQDNHTYTVPPTPVQSLASSPESLNIIVNDSDIIPAPQQNEPLASIINFPMQPTWQLPERTGLRGTWIEGNGPFITNGPSAKPPGSK